MRKYRQNIKYIAFLIFVSYLYRQYIPYKEGEFLNGYQLAQKYNYPTEYHEIYSKSGHQLSLLRLQQKNQPNIIDPYSLEKQQQNFKNQQKTKLKPVMLLHGLFSDMNCFFAPKEEEAYPFVLANQGYDVWVVNFRGNNMVQKHLNYTINDPQFWDFDVTDFAKEDMPLFMKMVGEFTNQQIDIVTFSLGGSITATALAMQDKYVEKYLGKAVLLCPGFGPWNVWLGPLFKYTKFPTIARFLGFQGFYYTRILYDMSHVLPDLLKFGWSLTVEGTGQYNYERSMYQLAHFPSSTSMKLLEHVSQFDSKREYKLYDYGVKRNIEIYGTPKPTQFYQKDLRKGNFYILYGSQDTLVPNIDIDEFVASVPQLDIKLHKFENQGHCSFVNTPDIEPLEKTVQIITGDDSFKLVKQNNFYENKNINSQTLQQL